MPVFSKELSTKAMVPVCRQIATAYEAGIPIIRVMETVGAQQRNPAVRRVLESIGRDLSAGATLAEATANHSEYLSPYFANLLGSGEQSGKLDTMLNDLATYYEDKLALQRKITGALAYPIFLISACWFLGTFAFGIVRNTLANINSRTSGAQNISEYLKEYLSLQVNAMGILAILIIIAIVLSRMGLLKWITCMITTHIWPLSVVTRKLGMARFFRSLGLMFGSGISTTTSIEKSAAVVGNPYIEQDLLASIPLVRRGHTLVESFSECKMMTPLAMEMLMVGEQSGNMDGQLLKAAEIHQREADQAITMATQVMTTLIMAVAFTMVGGIVIYFWTSFYGGLMDGLGI
jgi:type II secretory pathway component PulF